MTLTPENLSDLLLYRDALILVINKPSGIAVHPGKGPAPNLSPFLKHLRFGLPKSPEIAHRLDKDTSGCLILGRNPHALKLLGHLFSTHFIEKEYLALVKGAPPGLEGCIDLPLGKQSKRSDCWWMKVDKEHGQPAITFYKVLRQEKDYSLLSLKPITGRTHQLRVHCAAVGCPILGDKIYGTAASHPLCLHASSLKIPLYPKKGPLLIEAPLPDYMKESSSLKVPPL